MIRETGRGCTRPKWKRREPEQRGLWRKQVGEYLLGWSGTSPPGKYLQPFG